MKRALINPDLCVNCSPCVVEVNCDRRAAFRESENPSQKPWIDFYQCSGCMKCFTLCPAKAIIEISQPCTGKGRMSF